VKLPLEEAVRRYREGVHKENPGLNDYELEVSCLLHVPFGNPMKGEFCLSVMRMKWPDVLYLEKNGVENYWFTRGVRAMCRHKKVYLMGSASAGKSFMAGAFVETMWGCSPWNTSVKMPMLTMLFGEPQISAGILKKASRNRAGGQSRKEEGGMIPCIAMPILNRRDLGERMIRSIDFPVAHLLIIDNGNVFSDADTSNLPRAEGLIHHAQMHQNLGCAGSWNYAMHRAFEELNLESVLIVGNDVTWVPGDLARIWQTYLDFPEADFIFGNHSFGNFMVKRSGFEKVRWFWEEMYPAYWEDGDYWTRIMRSGAKAIHAAGLRATHDGSATIKSDTAIARLSNGRFQHNARLYAEKWGYVNKVETFATPYNQGGDVNDWELSEERKKLPYFRCCG